MQFNTSFDNQLFHFSVRIFVLAIVYAGFLLGQVSTQYHGNPDHIVFPGPIDSRSRALKSADKDSADHSDTLIPLDLAIRLNSIESSDEFLQLLQDVPENEKEPTTSVQKVYLNSRFGEGEERSNAEKATPAKCMPELQPVSLKQDNDPSTIFFPSCTRIKRCGGCCGSSLLSCQPIAMETRNFEVIVASLTTELLSYRNRQIVPLEEHTKCKCDCKVKEEHCNDKQHYESHNCKCVCDNVDEEQKCRKSNDTKIWNPDLCICSCRTIEPCSTGYYFNYNTCRCAPIMLPRPINRSTKGSNYNFSNRRPENVPPVIIPLDPSDPRRKHKEDPEYK